MIAATNGDVRSAPPAPARLAAPAYPPAWHGGLVLAALIAAFLVSFTDRHLLGLMVAPVKADLGITDFEMSLLVGFAFSLFYAVFGLPSGRLADRVSRKWLIVGGVVLWSIATTSSGLANSFATLFACRIAVGVGEGVLAPASYSLLGDLFPPRRLVRAASILSLAATLSAGVALVIGGQVVRFANGARAWPLALAALQPWQRAFVLVGLPGFAMALILLAIREPARHEGGPAAERLEGRVFAFLWNERGLYLPILLTGAGMSFMLSNGLNWFPTHLIRAFGESPARAGLILGTVQIAGSIVGALGGLALTEHLMRRGHSDAPLRSVMFTALGTALLTVLFFARSREATIGLWALSVALQNTYYGNIIAALQLVTPNRARGTVTALLYLMINVLGVGLGSALVGLISSRLFATDPRGIGYALALVGGGGALLAAASARLGLARYRLARAAFASSE